MTAATQLIRRLARICARRARDIGHLRGDDVAIPGVDKSQLETACLQLAELPEALAIVQAARRGASDQNRHSRGCPRGKGKTRQSPGRQHVPSSA